MMRNNKLNGLGRGLVSCGVIFTIVLSEASVVHSAEVTFGPEVNLGWNLISSNKTLLPVDLDGDGDLDLAMTTAWSDGAGLDQVVWLENNGAVTTSCTTHVVSNRFAGTVVAADLDKDGDVDLVSNGDNLMWHVNNGVRTPSFTDQLIADYPDAAALCVADLNKDGNVDLLIGRSIGKTISWLENSGGAHPTFTEHPLSVNSLPELCTNIAVADLDKDGDLDVIIACGGINTPGMSYWFENNGGITPTFTRRLLVMDRAGRITPGDINGDGWTDLLIGCDWYQTDKATTISLTRHPVNETLSNTLQFSESTLVDFDGDGDLDVMAFDASHASGYQAVWWFENDGLKPLPNFIKHEISKVKFIYGYGIPGKYLTGLAACDLDRDGDVDPLLLYKNDGVLWYPNQRLSPRPVAVFKPNGGEQFKSGNPMKVAWRTSVTTAGTAVGVELWRSTTAKVATLLSRAEGRADNGVGSTWVTIPQDVATRSDYRVRLVSLKNSYHYDFSDGPFTITRTNAAAPLNWTGYE